MTETNGNAKVDDVSKVIGENAQEAARQLSHSANEARKEAVKQLHKVADVIRKQAHEGQATPEAIANADKVAGGLEKAANYLNSHTIEDMGQEATKTVRENPWRSVAIVFILGVLIGIFLRRD